MKLAIVSSATGEAGLYLYHGDTAAVKYSKIPRGSLLAVNPTSDLIFKGEPVDCLFLANTKTKNAGLCFEVGTGVTDDEPSVNNPEKVNGYNVFGMPLDVLSDVTTFESLVSKNMVIGEEITWSEIYGLEEWFPTIKTLAAGLDTISAATVNLLEYVKAYS
jgi:hypothetical protein